jgi:hypothetical protein
MLIVALSVFAWCGFGVVRIAECGMYEAMNAELGKRLIRFQPATTSQEHCVVWMWLMAMDA